MRFWLVLAATLCASTSPTLAQSRDQAMPSYAIDERKMFVFAGPMGESTMDGMLFPITADYENAAVIGGGYQQFFLEIPQDFKIGGELGAAIRLGEEETTGELWAGVVGRYDGFVLGDIRIAPSLTFGLSTVTDTMGVEAEREAEDGLSGNLVFYLSPEISFAHMEHPELEVFWRLHHRSPAWNTLGGGTANATTFGIRYQF
ncbi:hypothetical protein [Pelagibacterium xiamenense]|uniref:hypothetical protein n=1 Tax=Pelagibacterium xiamenense TaxID=2901140 RepID=UPI001E47C2B2|nr:hypothetical protein [Pelagibacterium xiamenense]MCD7061043.1 hypothetical protein [Pelagibacterium xiamenense]